jgi:hypothetical protein
VRYCICKHYYNPDKLMVSCPNTACNKWLHADCLVDGILTEKCKPLNEAKTGEAERMFIEKRKTKKRKIVLVKKPYEGVFSAEIIGGEGTDPPQVQITDLRIDVEHASRKWTEAIVCPECSMKIE